MFLFSEPEFQSTLPVGGATAAEISEEAVQVISIHAPRGGSDRTLEMVRKAG